MKAFDWSKAEEVNRLLDKMRNKQRTCKKCQTTFKGILCPKCLPNPITG